MSKELVEAARAGDLSKVNQLLDDPHVNPAYNYNEALRVAALRGHLKIVKKLLKIPAVLGDMRALSSALNLAARRGGLAIVERLLQIPMVQDSAHLDGNKALLLATKEGHLEIVNRLLEIPTVRENAHLSDSSMLDEGIGDFCFSSGVLGVATAKGHLAIVERLLQIPKIVENVHINDNMALQMAAAEGHLDVVYALCKAYQAQRMPLPTDITIQNQSLKDFIKEREKKLEVIQENLRRRFSQDIIKIIDEYARISLDKLPKTLVFSQQKLNLEPDVIKRLNQANRYKAEGNYLEAYKIYKQVAEQAWGIQNYPHIGFAYYQMHLIDHREGSITYARLYKKEVLCEYGIRIITEPYRGLYPTEYN